MGGVSSQVTTRGPQISIVMERILLGVICLSGCRIFSSGLLRQYHHVPELMTWAEARAYCRETYADLAAIESADEMNQLVSASSPAGTDYVWIGLRSTISWRYSDEYNDTIRPGNDFCVLRNSSGELWWDHQCSAEAPFVCNNGTLQSPEFVHVAAAMNWSSAQKYCRENHTDLASGRNETQLREITSLVAEEHWAWTGLFADPIIDWSDGSDFGFRHWYSPEYEVLSTDAACAAASLQTSGRWLLFPCETTLPVACSSDPPPDVFLLAVKLRIEPGRSSLDPNDPAVKADILRQLQDRLKESGLSGVTLNWREQPDGKVFT
ncbi:secretory phospholipase A2 receptor-like [Acanthopagrus latus]|uniref:secretory phospholipase A2 receptor-like n=1 Tax=Acanthopagrus latus TaxID=8177 RepID=UPI00187C6B1F|nr:secretory phospholipase A2 receptor-like [Acanthopagrus latus]